MDSLRSGLVAEYLFAGNAEDTSGNAHHGRAIGPNPTEDRFGRPNQAYAFDGLNDYVLVLPPPAWGGDALSLSVWARYDREPPAAPPDAPPWEEAWSNVVVAQDNGDEFEVGFRYPNPRRIFQVCTRNGSLVLHRPRKGKDVVGVERVSAGHWYHIAVVMDGAAEIHRLYIDGEFRAEQKGRVVECPQEPLYIGRQAPPAKHGFFRGAIDDLRIYARVLSDEEIHALHVERP